MVGADPLPLPLPESVPDPVLSEPPNPEVEVGLYEEYEVSEVKLIVVEELADE